MKTRLILFFSFISYFISGQETYKISGKILSESDEPVAYAHIGIPNIGKGTVSNINGDYFWNIKCNLTDSIYISHLSYNLKKLTVQELLEEPQVILLDATNSLNEIRVLPNSNLVDMFEKTLKSIPQNYSSKLNVMQGFYREIQYTSTTQRNTRMLEAAFNTQDRGYRSALDNIRIDVINLRKSDSFSKKNLLTQILQKNFPELANNLYSTLRSNPLRSYYPYKREAKKNFLHTLSESENLRLELQAVNYIEGREYYTIAFDQKSRIFREQGSITIDTKSYSIIELTSNTLLNDKLIQSYLIKFALIQNTYFPVFIKKVNITDVRKDENNRSSNGYSENTIVITDHFLKRSDFELINRKFDLKNKGDLYNQEFEYDSIFWSNYNILLEEPIAEKVVIDLEKNRSLNDQFNNPKQQ